MTFSNSARPIVVDQAHRKRGGYAFDAVSPYLRLHNRLLQAVVSQAGTYLLTHKFHTGDHGIHKAEGGCNIAGVGELVLYKNYCDFYLTTNLLPERADPLYRLGGLITNIVLGWNPEDPQTTLLRHGAINANCETKALKSAIEAAQQRTACAGNRLEAFFGSPTMLTALSPIERDYYRWCMLEIYKRPLAEVDAIIAELGPKDFKQVLVRSSIGAGLANIRDNGLDAELADLDDEMHGGRRKS